MEWVWIWLGVVVVGLVVEFITLDLVSFWFAVGGFVAMILALCGVNYIAQLIVAIVLTLACILGLRKVTLKFLNRNQEKTNLDLAVGEKVKIISKVTPDKMGTAKYNGLEWSVKEQSGNETIKEGKYATIVKIEGNKLIVKPCLEANEKQVETTQEEKKVEKKEKVAKKVTQKAQKDNTSKE